ncbi:MAG TPA: FMN-binding glutamate synthase family protein, partial [Gammaproteobacteria bacterium]|nr:FMN-binding glutamate synthase family protein [Gammaproteobacteria bacterium]
MTSTLFGPYALLLLVLGLILVFIYIQDSRQKEHAILRNFPIIGHFRYILEGLGVYLRQFWFAQDREELPFNRATRSWVYRAAKNEDMTVGFGSTRDLRPVGTVLFVDAPFPVLGEDASEIQPVTIGPYCRIPYVAKSLFNISAMSYGSISKNAVLALAEGAKIGGCWLNTGEGGVSRYHLESGCDLVAQIGTAKYGFCDANGKLSDEALRGVALYPQIKMFELKLSQGAKPGKGGILPAVKVTPEIAEIRFIKAHQDSISPNRHPEISNVQELMDFIEHIRTLTGKPVGFKIVIGSYEWLDDLCIEILKRGIENAPDFITLDGAEGGTGAAPASLIDYMGLPIAESLPVLIDKLVEYGLRDRIKVIAGGKLITPAEVAWALCMGADFVASARGFAFALGCIQALKCHTNTCPTGITTHQPHLVQGLDPATKAVRVANYLKRILYET